MVSVKYDKESNAIYVKFLKKKAVVAKTISLGHDKFMDMDENNNPIGIELVLKKPINSEVKKAIKVLK